MMFSKNEQRRHDGEYDFPALSFGTEGEIYVFNFPLNVNEYIHNLLARMYGYHSRPPRYTTVAPLGIQPFPE